MVFEVSDVPLTEDVISKKNPFVFNYYDWLSTKGTRIIKSSFSIGTSTNLYTVPEGKILFIVSSWITGMKSSAGTGVGAFLEVNNSSIRLIGVQISDSNNNSGASNSNSYPFPIKIESGESITSSVGNSIQFSGGFAGFLVNKSDLVFI